MYKVTRSEPIQIYIREYPSEKHFNTEEEWGRGLKRPTENEPIEYPDDTEKMNGWRRSDGRPGEIQETTKRTGSRNDRLCSYFTQRRIRRWGTIMERIFHIV